MPRSARKALPTRVYRIAPDENYQRLAIVDDPEADNHKIFGAEPLAPASMWLTARVVNPAARAGSLWYVEGGALAVTLDRNKPPLEVMVPALGLRLIEPHPSAHGPNREVIQGHLEMAGQILPLMVGRTEMLLLNVLECPACLDRQQTDWLDGPSPGPDAHIAHYAFVPDQLVVSSIFKIPETRGQEVLIVERTREAEMEFKAAVTRYHLKGIAFELLWEGQSE